jgi:hypothetical protein
MRRIQLGLRTATLPALALTLLGWGHSSAARERPAAPKAVVGTSYDANVTGKIVWKGWRDKAYLDGLTAKYRKALEAGDKLHCFTKAPEADKVQQVYRIGSNGNVGNVFVWLEAPDRGSFIRVPDKQVKEHAGGKKNVTLAQPHCTFVPRCFVLFPRYKGKDGKEKLTGQKLEIVNDAKFAHNVKWLGDTNSGDTGTMPSGMKTSKVLRPDRKPVQFECNIHNWMRAYAWVFDHPYATVSKIGPAKAFGTFTIANAPTGVPLKLLAWHEADGFLETPRKPIVLKAGANRIDIDFRPAKGRP